MKRLIFNADDFGFTRDVNAGIVHCHRKGVLTATTLMANGPAFDDAVRLARATPTLDIGCHLVLVQGHSLITGRLLPETPARLVKALARRELDIYAELRAQIEAICAAGIEPTHLDTHKHTHLAPQVFREVVRLAHEFSIPWVRLPLGPPMDIVAPFFREIAERYRVRMTDHFRGFRLTGSLTEKRLRMALLHLPEGTTEFMCHPGFLGPELQAARTRLKESRVREMEALTSPRVRQLIFESGVRLSRFGTVADGGP